MNVALVRRIRLAVGRLLSLFRELVLGRNVVAVAVRTGSDMFLVPVADVYVSRGLATGGHDSHVVEQLRRTVRFDDAVLVIGAHVGAVAIPISGFVSRTVAIEANPRTFELLQSNIAINGAGVESHRFAASRETRTVRFLASKVNSGGSKIVPTNLRHEYYYDQPEEIVVEAHRIDEVFEAQRFEHVVLDVEGHELDALMGMGDLLSGVRQLVLEVTPAHIQDAGSLDGLVSLLDSNFDEYVPLNYDMQSRDRFLDIFADTLDLADPFVSLDVACIRRM